MKRILTFLLASVLCHAAFAQTYIKNDLKLKDKHVIVCEPCIQNQGEQQYAIWYNYMENTDIKIVTLEMLCSKQESWWTVAQDTRCIVKFAPGGFHTIDTILSEIKSYSDNIIYISFYVKDYEKHLDGISEIMFRTTTGSPASIKITIDEKCREHLQKSLAELLHLSGLKTTQP